MTVEELFASHTPEVRAIAALARELILGVYPDAVEQVDGPDHLIAYGRGIRISEQLWYIAPFKAHVNIGFMRGTEQADPSGLLEGTGKRLRHVKLRSRTTLLASPYSLCFAPHLALPNNTPFSKAFGPPLPQHSRLPPQATSPPCHPVHMRASGSLFQAES